MNKKILDFFLLNEKEGGLSLDDSSKQVMKAVNSIKVVPQMVSVVTIIVSITSVILSVTGVEFGSALYILISILMAALGFILGFKLEKSIEAIFCHPVRLLKNKEVKKNLSTFIFTSLTAIVLIAFSFKLSDNSKTIAVLSAFDIETFDYSQLFSLIGFEEKGDAKVELDEEERNIIKDYEAQKKQSRADARNAKTKADRVWLNNGNINQIENKKQKALAAYRQSKNARIESEEKVALANIKLASELIAATQEKEKGRQEKVNELKSEYLNLITWTIRVSVLLSLFLYIVKVLNEKK